MDSPILDFFAFQSARYDVKRDRWHDVAIEVWHHPGHEYNVDTMIAATKAGLDYFTAAFGPYQHKQFRIIEFPRYDTFAQSFPNTIPYSEGIGFIARVRPDDPEDIDYPYYVTAHELAHQWWGHQVPGGNVQGETFLVETLAQYSALMVMKQKYGEAKMQRFLQYELDRYLLGRSTEQKKELPLARVENQDYIHYRRAPRDVRCRTTGKNGQPRSARSTNGRSGPAVPDARLPRRCAVTARPRAQSTTCSSRSRCSTTARSPQREGVARRPLQSRSTSSRRAQADELGKESSAARRPDRRRRPRRGRQGVVVEKKRIDRGHELRVHRRRAPARAGSIHSTSSSTGVEGQHGAVAMIP
jgi:aminopeptidase N